MADIDGIFSIDGIVKERKELEALLATDPKMEKRLQKVIRKVLQRVRKDVMAGAKGALKSDPRQAYKAVKTSVYRQILGGSVSILNPRKAATHFTAYQPPRKIRQGKRGGNRRLRSPRTAAVQSYGGQDRAFILRFVNSGTDARYIDFTPNDARKVDKWNRHPNTGYRGKIAPRNFFGNVSHQSMRRAAEYMQQLIDDIIKEEFNK